MHPELCMMTTIKLKAYLQTCLLQLRWKRPERWMLLWLRPLMWPMQPHWVGGLWLPLSLPLSAWQQLHSNRDVIAVCWHLSQCLSR